MTRAFADLFAVQDAFRHIPLPGRTDRMILADAASAHGVPPERLDDFQRLYLSHLVEEIERPGPGKHVMPGVRPLLDALGGRDDVYVALLTGNYRAAARIKLEYFDLWKYFPCGAFGDDAPDRNGLLPEALARVRACGGPSVDVRDVVVVGDTPLDVACAAASGARSLAVATGNYGVDALRASGADSVFGDLSNLPVVLAALTDVA